MIGVRFDPNRLTGKLKTDWEAWQKKAEVATEAVIQAWEDWRDSGSLGVFRYDFDEKIWGDLKEWLVKNVFHNKCAYCETREVRSPYHAEHFRPKARVTVKVEGKKKQQVCTTQDEYGRTIPHPGYFWLAYTWSNLLPSCNYCNTARGKKNQFPIKEKVHISVKQLSAGEAARLKCKRIESRSPGRVNIYYLQPEDLTEMEDPLLLHPYLDDPNEHLVFGEFGVVTPKDSSPKGRHSIEVYNLDSEPLVTARRNAQETALREYSLELIRGKGVSNTARIAAAKLAIAGYISGDEPYSSAVLANLNLIYQGHKIPSAPVISFP